MDPTHYQTFWKKNLLKTYISFVDLKFQIRQNELEELLSTNVTRSAVTDAGTGTAFALLK